MHSTEIDSYAEVARRAGILDDAGLEAYLAESVRAAHVVGLADAPSSRADMRAYLDRVRPDLKLTDEARQGVGNLFEPLGTTPTTRKLAFSAVATLALGTLPRWAADSGARPASTDLGTTPPAALRGLTNLLRTCPHPGDRPGPALVRAIRTPRSRCDERRWSCATRRSFGASRTGWR